MDVATKSRIACKHCVATTPKTELEARTAGWRFYRGASLTGKQLDDVICPSCAGSVDPNDPESMWDVQCTTCGWEYISDYDGEMDELDRLKTENDAKQVAKDHDCEPELRLRPPHGEWTEAKEAWRW